MRKPQKIRIGRKSNPGYDRMANRSCMQDRHELARDMARNFRLGDADRRRHAASRDTEIIPDPRLPRGRSGHGRNLVVRSGCGAIAGDEGRRSVSARFLARSRTARCRRRMVAGRCQGGGSVRRQAHSGRHLAPGTFLSRDADLLCRRSRHRENYGCLLRHGGLRHQPPTGRTLARRSRQHRRAHPQWRLSRMAKTAIKWR